MNRVPRPRLLHAPGLLAASITLIAMQDGLRAYTTRWRVRQYELDVNAHVNNAVYLNYAEQVATEHAELLGFGRAWSQTQNGTWVVRRHEITYHQPATYGDELELTTHVETMRGARATRRTAVVFAGSRQPVVDVATEWVWIRLSDGRPSRTPAELVAAFVSEPSPA